MNTETPTFSLRLPPTSNSSISNLNSSISNLNSSISNYSSISARQQTLMKNLCSSSNANPNPLSSFSFSNIPGFSGNIGNTLTGSTESSTFSVKSQEGSSKNVLSVAEAQLKRLKNKESAKKSREKKRIKIQQDKERYEKKIENLEKQLNELYRMVDQYKMEKDVLLREITVAKNEKCTFMKTQLAYVLRINMLKEKLREHGITESHSAIPDLTTKKDNQNSASFNDSLNKHVKKSPQVRKAVYHQELNPFSMEFGNRFSTKDVSNILNQPSHCTGTNEKMDDIVNDNLDDNMDDIFNFSMFENVDNNVDGLDVL